MSPIAQDLSALPKATRSTGGEPPDTHPRFVQLLVEKFAAANEEAGPKATAFGTKLRHSDAGKCARALAYRAAQIPESNPMDLAGTWVTSLGTLIHEAWQEALQERYPDARVEVKLRVDGLDASGHSDADLVIPEGGEWVDVPDSDAHPGGDSGFCDKRVVVELKTCGGFSYKMKVGERGNPEGPSYEHKAQAALNGLAVDADEIVIAYLATEAISKPAAVKKGIDEVTRFAAEWSYSREEFEPWARVEQARMQAVLDLLDTGVLAPRKFPVPELPKGHEVVDPTTGRWQVVDADGKITDTGTFWPCGYCPWQATCATTRPGRIPVEEVLGADAA